MHMRINKNVIVVFILLLMIGFIGSNFATPTISIEAVKNNTSNEGEAAKALQNEKLLKQLLNKF